GIKIGKHRRLPGIGYADDIILFAPSDQAIQTLINICNDFYQSIGLSINESKSVVMGAGSTITINGKPIPEVESIKYLGVTIDRDGIQRTKRKDIAELLDKITRANITANQKLYFIKRHLIPSKLHKMVNENFTRTDMLAIDCEIRQAVRKVLHLPTSTPYAFFHLSTKNGGLGILQLSFEIPRLFWMRAAKLERSKSWYVKDMFDHASFAKTLRKAYNLLPAD